MKASALPSIRVEAALRQQIEGVLNEGETLSGFIENSVRDSLRRRSSQAEFVARGLASLASARETGDYVDPQDTLKKMRDMLAAARAQAAAKNPTRA